METIDETLTLMSNDDLIRLAQMLRIPLTSRYVERKSVVEAVSAALAERGTEGLWVEKLQDPAIAVVSMRKEFGRKVAVEALDLFVRPGEIVGLVGPNGAGKTTTLRVIAGIIRPTSGDVSVNGVSVGDSSLEAKRIVGYIPERPTCYEDLRVREYLTFVAKVYGVPPHVALLRISRFARMLQLEEYLDTYVGALSKGNLQRTLLAGIFVRPPPYILLLDEPIYGLDPRGAWSLKRHLRHLRETGSAILLSTHILEVAEGLCDRFVIMHEGKVVGRGTLESLRKRFPDARNLEEVFLELTGGIPEE